MWGERQIWIDNTADIWLTNSAKHSQKPSQNPSWYYRRGKLCLKQCIHDRKPTFGDRWRVFLEWNPLELDHVDQSEVSSDRKAASFPGRSRLQLLFEPVHPRPQTKTSGLVTHTPTAQEWLTAWVTACKVSLGQFQSLMKIWCNASIIISWTTTGYCKWCYSIPLIGELSLCVAYALVLYWSSV